ncbi:ferritin [Methanosphaerula palustris]|uniref:Ferritin Dps family protein n=1 Tax=Methanosphaerula palustris (strain ATCC BAA-1556 / DSM 19958 / E1-9c) TaxID=521011 RepID=B8GGN7_METPE|nr:ferritin [Methanosphaerula palustris]ACL16292.1 Ferritin Dps family protein [Methanosphaerula palustris E1-9c]
MIKKSIEEALNKQVNREYYSAYLYLSMSSYLDSINLKGFAHWLRVQAREELAHGMKLYDHLIAMNGRALLQPIEAPPEEWKSTEEVFEQVYDHEQKVTAMISALMDLTLEKKDYATAAALQWFVTEQIEEEGNALAILEQIKTVGDVPGHLFYLDHHLAKRE